MSENDIFQKSEFYIELANIQHKTTIQIHKCSQYNLQPIPFYAPDALLWKRATKPFKCVRKKWQQEFCQSKRKIKENMQIFINIFSFFCLFLDFNPPPPLKKKKNGSWNSPRNNFTTNQHSLPKKKNGSWNSTRNNFTTNQIKIFLSVQNKNSENFENLEITPKAKFIIEGIYKAFFEHKCIT